MHMVFRYLSGGCNTRGIEAGSYSNNACEEDSCLWLQHEEFSCSAYEQICVRGLFSYERKHSCLNKGVRYKNTLLKVGSSDAPRTQGCPPRP